MWVLLLLLISAWLLLLLLFFLDDDAVDIQQLLLFLFVCLVKMCLRFLLSLLLVWMLFLHVGGGIGAAIGCSACCGIGFNSWRRNLPNLWRCRVRRQRILMSKRLRASFALSRIPGWVSCPEIIHRLRASTCRCNTSCCFLFMRSYYELRAP